MSDSEREEIEETEFGEYESDLDVPADPLAAAENTEESVGEDPGNGEETGEEGEAVSDDEIEEEEEEDHYAEGGPGEEEVGEEAIAAKKAAPQRQRIDPIARLSQATRTTISVPPDQRTTSNVLQKSEATRLIAMRAEQISKNPTLFIKEVPPGVHDPVGLARAELLARSFPLMLNRFMGRTDSGDPIVEPWDPNVMTLPPLI